MPLKKGENDMTSNKVIKILIVFILCMTVLGCSASTAFADTIYDCSYLINVGEKSYSDTLFYQLITSVPEAADDFENIKYGGMYSIIISDGTAIVEYINMGDRDKCHLWFGIECTPAQICIDCIDTLINSPVLVYDVSSGEIYSYSSIDTDDYVQFVLDMLS